MAAARIVRARIVILTAGLVGTLAARAPAVEPDQVLELGVLTYAAFEALKSRSPFRPHSRCWPPAASRPNGASAWATTAVLNPPPAVLSSACSCFP